jgi:hypothetical protein
VTDIGYKIQLDCNAEDEAAPNSRAISWGIETERKTQSACITLYYLTAFRFKLFNIAAYFKCCEYENAKLKPIAKTGAATIGYRNFC